MILACGCCLYSVVRLSLTYFTVFSACTDSFTVFLLCPADLIHCTNELNVSIPHLADTLLERTASNSWIVVFKALITTHHLMMYGNEVSWTHRPLLSLIEQLENDRKGMVWYHKCPRGIWFSLKHVQMKDLRQDAHFKWRGRRKLFSSKLCHTFYHYF